MVYKLFKWVYQQKKMLKVLKMVTTESQKMLGMHASHTTLDPGNQKELVEPSNLF